MTMTAKQVTAKQVVEAHKDLVWTGALPGMKNISVGIEAVIIEWNGRSAAMHPDLADAYLLHLEAAACAEHGDWVRVCTDSLWMRVSCKGVRTCTTYRDGVLANARDRFLPKPEAKVEAPRPVVVIDGVRYVPEQKQ